MGSAARARACDEPPTPAVDLRAVIDALPRAIVVTDPHGAITLFNREAERLYGWREDEVLGRTTLEVLAPVDAPSDTIELLAQVLAGHRYVGDRTVLRRDGVPLRVSVYTQAVLDDDGEVVAVIGAAEDIAEMRQLEQQARDLTEHLGLALEASGLGTWVWDMATGTVTWDERMEDLFGFEVAGFDGTFDAYQRTVHPDDRDRLSATIDAAVTSGDSFHVEHRIITPAGEVRWISGSGTVLFDEAGHAKGAIGCSADVTEQARARLEREAAAAAALAAAEEERLHSQRLEFLARITDELADAPSRDDVMRAVTSAAVPHLGDWCSIYVLPGSGAAAPLVETAHLDPAMAARARRLHERFPYDPDAATGVARVIRTGQSELHRDLVADLFHDRDAGDEVLEVVRELELRSEMVVPLVKAGRVLGALQFVMADAGRHYTPDDLTLAEAVAGRVAASLENRRLAEQQHVIATTLQQSLLPDHLPSIPGLQVAVRYWATGEGTDVGGDFYDVFAAGEDSWVTVIGDVCGTGPAAASLTSLARHSIRQSVWRGDDPRAVFTWLNRAMLESTSMSFLTAAHVGLRPRLAPAQEDGPSGYDLTVTAAGHPLPVLVTNDGRVRRVGRHGSLIGVLPEVVVHPMHDVLERGDALVLYTDGVTDVPPPHGIEDDDVSAFIRAAAWGQSSAETIASSIHRALVEKLPLDAREDDIALLVLRVET